MPAPGPLRLRDLTGDRALRGLQKLQGLLPDLSGCGSLTGGLAGRGDALRGLQKLHNVHLKFSYHQDLAGDFAGLGGALRGFQSYTAGT